MTPKAPKAVKFHDIGARAAPIPILLKSTKALPKGILKKVGKARSGEKRAVRWRDDCHAVKNRDGQRLGEVEWMKKVPRWIGVPQVSSTPSQPRCPSPSTHIADMPSFAHRSRRIRGVLSSSTPQCCASGQPRPRIGMCIRIRQNTLDASGAGTGRMAKMSTSSAIAAPLHTPTARALAATRNCCIRVTSAFTCTAWASAARPWIACPWARIWCFSTSGWATLTASLRGLDGSILRIEACDRALDLALALWKFNWLLTHREILWPEGSWPGTNG